MCCIRSFYYDNIHVRYRWLLVFVIWKIFFKSIKGEQQLSIYSDTQTNDRWKRQLFVPKGSRLDQLYFVFVQWCVVGDVNLYQKKNWEMRKSGNKTTYTLSFVNRLSRYVCVNLKRFHEFICFNEIIREGM